MSRIGILDSLEREQKDLLVTWIETLPIKLVLEKVASAPPEGFNIRTHITSLRRFYQRERNSHTRENIDYARGAILTINDAEVIRQAAMDALTHHAFEIATTPGFGEFELSRAARWLTALQQHEIKLEQLKLRREKLLLEKQRLQIMVVIKEADAITDDGVRTIREAAAQLWSLHKDKP